MRPGDELRGRVTILEATPSSTRPDRGTIRAMNRYSDDGKKKLLGARFTVRLPVQ